MQNLNFLKLSTLIFNTAFRVRIIPNNHRYISIMKAVYSGNDLGRGDGKGGGKGGAIRDAGGSFGKREAAHEEEYFKRMEREKINGMKKYLQDELKSHEEEIENHTDAIERHKQRIKEIKEVVGKK